MGRPASDRAAEGGWASVTACQDRNCARLTGARDGLSCLHARALGGGRAAGSRRPARGGGRLGPAAGSAGAVKLTFIGDSKAAGIEFSTKAKRLLRRGHDVRRDLKVCRRLVAPSCAYQGVVPRTALEAIRHYGTDLGTVLVIDVGYNDSSSTYRGQLNQVMRAAARPRGEGRRLGEPQGRSPRLPKDQLDHQPAKGALAASSTSPTGTSTRGDTRVVRQLGRRRHPPDLGGRRRASSGSSGATSRSPPRGRATRRP